MKKLFTNDKFFLAMVLCAVIGEGALVCINVFVDGFAVQAMLSLLFRVLCVIFLYSSYKRHNKNVTKGLMGALIGVQVITAFQYLSEITNSVGIVCIPLFAIFSVLLFINHFIINSDHHSNPKMILLNQILVVLLFLTNAVWMLRLGFYFQTATMWIRVPCDIIGFFGMTASIVCVESRLDAYRLDREAAGWTEETGYPEDYVHEYEKK